MKFNRKAIKRKYWFWRLLPLVLLVSMITGIGLLFLNPGILLGLLFAANAQSQDMTYASPDKAYIATVRDVDTGAIGSFSDVSLKSKWNILPPLTSVWIADGRYGAFGKVRWLNNHTMQLSYPGQSPDPQWPTHWHGVTITYSNTE